MQSFKDFITEEAKSNFGVKLKGEHIGDGLHYLGKHIYAQHGSKGYKDGHGTAHEMVRVHYDHSKDPERQRGRYRDVHMPEKEIGHVMMEKKKGEKARFISNTRDKTLLGSSKFHVKEHPTFHKAFKHILNSQKEIRARESKQAENAATMHSYRNFSQDGNRR